MIKKFLPLVALFTTSCATVPVTPPFPQAPVKLKEPCEDLSTIADGATLSAMMITITLNYMKYHNCAAKKDSWNEWYEKQAEIQNNIGKKK